MIEGGLAPFETPFFFILIDPSKGSWRQLAAVSPSFLGLEALPCGARGLLRGWRSLRPPVDLSGPHPGGIYAGLVDPHPPMRGGLTPSSALLPVGRALRLAPGYLQPQQKTDLPL